MSGKRRPEGSPAVSVVVPTYNRASLLGRALESVEAQSFRDFEVVVVDDGSTDDTAARLRDWGTRHGYRAVFEPHQGAAAARNRGARVAQGEILTFLDSDDTVEPVWLEKTLPVFAESNVGLVFCGARSLDAEGRPVETLLPHSMGPLLNGWTGFFNDGTFLVRRTIFEAVGGYAEDLSANQHTELGIRLVDLCDAKGWTGISVNETLVRFHDHAGPRIRSDSRAVLEATEYMIEHYRERLQRHPGDYLDYLAVAGTLAARLGERRRARRHLLEAVRFKPRAIKSYLRLARTFLPFTTSPRML